MKALASLVEFLVQQYVHGKPKEDLLRRCDIKNLANQIYSTKQRTHTIVNSNPPPRASPSTAATVGFLPSESIETII